VEFKENQNKTTAKKENPGSIVEKQRRN
jgi:hypothetical protein